ncbi:MAG: energy transducer TonB [Tannerella sp.]|jgi:TonB family protein|nr:energy transducer TonB [Tannerella sp.]
MKVDKNDRVALAGSVLFHLAILLLLCFTVLKTIVPEDDGGVLVNFGNLNTAAGMFEPRGRTAPVVTPEPEVTPKIPKPVPPREEMITQDEEETVSLTAKKEKERKKGEEAERKKREEQLAEQRRREEQRRQSQAIQDQVAGAFGSGNADGESQGDAPTGTGNQGSPFGNSDSGANEGVGGIGTFNLNGRSIGAGGLPRPSYAGQVEGYIVINITVDPKGNVIMAEIGRGTTIVDSSMRSSALDAAKRAKFNSITGTNNQSGTITYRYRFSK